MPYARASGEQIAECSQRFAAFGVRPVWFDKFDEIPALLGRIK
jgi:hypothetical protein